MNAPEPRDSNVGKLDESIGLNEESLMPEIQQYEKLLTDETTSIAQLVEAIKHIDRRAVSFFYSRNPRMKRSGVKETIIPKYRDFIYQSNHNVYKENRVLSMTLQEILKILLAEVRNFLKEWDKETSGYNIAMELAIINQIENEIKEKQKSFVPKILDQDDFLDEIQIFAKEMGEKHHREELRNALIEFAKPSFKSHIRNTTTTVGKLVQSGTKLGSNAVGEVFNMDNFGRFWYLYILGAISSAVVGPKYLSDYKDGHFSDMSEIIVAESEKSGEGEGERKYEIIETEIIPRLAASVRKINIHGSKVDWNDYHNSVFYFDSPSTTVYGSHININEEMGDLGRKILGTKEKVHNVVLGSGTCLSIDLSNFGSSNHIIDITYDTRIFKNEQLPYRLKDGNGTVASKGERINGEIVEVRCQLGTDTLAEKGLGESRDFLLTVLNHPQTIKKIRSRSETIENQQDQ